MHQPGSPQDPVVRTVTPEERVQKIKKVRRAGRAKAKPRDNLEAIRAKHGLTARSPQEAVNNFADLAASLFSKAIRAGAAPLGSTPGAKFGALPKKFQEGFNVGDEAILGWDWSELTPPEAALLQWMFDQREAAESTEEDLRRAQQKSESGQRSERLEKIREIKRRKREAERRKRKKKE